MPIGLDDLEHHVVLDVEKEVQHALAQPVGGAEARGDPGEALGGLLRARVRARVRVGVGVRVRVGVGVRVRVRVRVRVGVRVRVRVRVRGGLLREPRGGELYVSPYLPISPHISPYLPI